MNISLFKIKIEKYPEIECIILTSKNNDAIHAEML